MAALTHPDSHLYVTAKRYRSKRLSWLAVLLVLSLSPLQAAALVFKIATLSPDGATWMKKMREGATEIATRTEDRVKFKFYPGGIMGNDESVLRKIRIRQLQGGAVVSGALAKIYPDIQIYTLPFLFRSLEEVDYVRERMDKQLIRELEERGFVTFGLAEGGFGYLMTKAPVASITDLKQQKVWVQTGDTVTRVMLETAGVSPISLPISDVMTGLQTGLIDAIAVPPIAAIALQWHTRVKYITDTPLAYTYALLAVDRESFMKLRESDRKIVHEVMDRIFQEINRQNRIDTTGAINALHNQGIEFYEQQPQQFDRWRAIAVEARAQLGDQGVYSPSTLETLLKYLHAYRHTSSALAGPQTP